MSRPPLRAIPGFLLSLAAGCRPPQALPAADRGSRVELDHVFIVVEPGGAAGIAALESAGLTMRSEPTKHEGQGTASVAAMFENGYLELIWVDTTVSVDSEHATTHAWFRRAEAWRENGHSPFGFGLHRFSGDTAALEVPVRLEAADWLPPGSAYELLHQPSDTLAADFFVVPAVTAVPTWIGRARARYPKTFEHSGGGRAITLLRVFGAEAHEPAAFRVLRPGRIESVRAPEPLLELHLDEGPSERRTDLRPVLPLVVVRRAAPGQD